jgi:hypothetical protein
LLYVVLYDFLFGQGIRGGGAVKRAVTENKTALRAALARLKVRRKVASNAELLPAQLQGGTQVCALFCCGHVNGRGSLTERVCLPSSHGTSVSTRSGCQFPLLWTS